VSLTFCSEVSAADWIVGSDIPWGQLATFGPGGFAAYARLRFVPDPRYDGQRETDAFLPDPDYEFSPEDDPRRDVLTRTAEQWRVLLELLGAHTQTPDDCYFALWEGWPLPESLRQRPKFGVPGGARIPARSYFLFRGSLSNAEDWSATDFYSTGQEPYEPAFVWPADRAWCVACDVDPHWAGIGADEAVITRLIADTRLDAVAADPSGEQPTYR
jgi:hypothetical protein